MPHGTRPTSLWPRGARPRSRVMLVLVQVSSRKTRRRGSPHRQDVRFRETTSSDRATWMGAKRTPVLHKSSRLCENSIVEPPHVRIFLCCQTGRAERSTPAAPRDHLLLVAVTVQSFHTVCKNFAPGKTADTAPSSTERTIMLGRSCSFGSLGGRVARTRCKAIPQLFRQLRNIAF